MGIAEILEEIIKDSGIVEVYRGTIKKETLEFGENAKKEGQEALDKLEAKKKEFWDMVESELGLDPDKVYRLESHTGQIFEKVPKPELEPKDEEPENGEPTAVNE